MIPNATPKILLVLLFLWVGCKTSKKAAVSQKKPFVFSEAIKRRIKQYYGDTYIAKTGATIIGGEKALYKHLVYPYKAVEENIEGLVVLGFTVNEDGSISDIKIIKSLGYDCTKEAIKAVRSVKFHPYIRNGKPSKVVEILPIIFKLTN